MTSTTETAPEAAITPEIVATVNEMAISFHPTALDGSGRPQYRIGNQLRKLVRVGKGEGMSLCEVRWTRTKQGIWSVALNRSGKNAAVIELGKKRDLRDPRMMQAIRDLTARLIAEAKATEPEATEPEVKVTETETDKAAA